MYRTAAVLVVYICPTARRKATVTLKMATAIWHGRMSKQLTLQCAIANRRESFTSKKKAKRNGIVAIKAVAHKLARACYHMLRTEEVFSVERCFV